MNPAEVIWRKSSGWDYAMNVRVMTPTPTQKESAVALAVSLRTVQHLIESGALPVKRIGRRVLIHRRCWGLFRESHTCHGTPVS